MIQQLKNYFWHLPKSLACSLFYGFPSRHIKLIAITGTDGKTTTCNLVFQVLQNAGFKVGIISTVGAKVGDTLLPVPPHLTSPDPSLVQKIFKLMSNESVTHAVIEVTAHAIDQYRFAGCHFSITAITNTSHEHLDYFKNKSLYLKTKAKLFHHSPLAIANLDDPSFKYIIDQQPQKIISYSQKSAADFKVNKIKLSQNFLSFNINKLPISTDSAYSYQVNNITTAYAICHQLEIKDSIFQETVLNFPHVKGRREIVDNQFGFTTIIDFAHTPAALKHTLSSLKQNYPHSRLIVIFGATGGRDQSKRPLMGQVVQKYADIALITADDTRSENVLDINRQIISGISPKSSQSIKYSDQLNITNLKKEIHQPSKFFYFSIPQRQEAFNLAVLLANKDDVIIACGKGHETTILHGKTEYPWSEKDAFLTAFKFRNQHE